MGAYSDIFGNVPKVLLLEMFAENPEDELTASDIIEETGISKRETYLLLEKFVKEGLIVVKNGRPKRYQLNRNDLRANVLENAESLLIMGKIEAELKIDKHIKLSDPYSEESYKDKIFIKNYYAEDSLPLETSKDIKYELQRYNYPEPSGA